MTKTFTLNQGTLRPHAGPRKGLMGLLIASFFVALSTGAHADVFGSGSAGAGQAPASVADRLAALEKELKELKEKGGQFGPQMQGAPVPGKAPVAPGKPNLNLPPPLPGLEGLPAGGADERERLIVEKELTYEVLGTVNDMVLVRDGERRLVLTPKEFKAFEKEKRQKVVKKLKVDAVSEGDAKLSFPQLLPSSQDVMNAGGALNQAGQAVDQARAIEANGGQPPAPAAAPATVPGQARPAAPVKKN
ncbi:hypothetical protein [Burkholderia ubonensis]|uniref:hypothetical protein n=1 Tax=Burkholderia ubonensis TaxID=101571 RepID=UPI0007544BC3|nr:hypothetical protein [Burkholderia ubonensis]